MRARIKFLTAVVTGVILGWLVGGTDGLIFGGWAGIVLGLAFGIESLYRWE